MVEIINLNRLDRYREIFRRNEKLGRNVPKTYALCYCKFGMHPIPSGLNGIPSHDSNLTLYLKIRTVTLSRPSYCIGYAANTGDKETVMLWPWGFLIFFFIVFIATSFLFGWVRAADMVGREAVRRNLRYILLSMLLGCAFSFVILFLGKYRWVCLDILVLVDISIRGLTWFFHKKEFGNLLINIGRTSINKYYFSFGVPYALFVTLTTCLLFVQMPGEIRQSLTLEIISQFGFGWISVILPLAYGFSGLEFRENGICFMFIFLNWRRINSYNWEKSKPNVLTVWFKPRFPLFPGFMSIPIPTKHCDVVSQILDEQLPGGKL